MRVARGRGCRDDGQACQPTKAALLPDIAHDRSLHQGDIATNHEGSSDHGHDHDHLWLSRDYEGYFPQEAISEMHLRVQPMASFVLKQLEQSSVPGSQASAQVFTQLQAFTQS
jgi:hypothetical protein